MSRQETVTLTNMVMVEDENGKILVEDKVDPHWKGISFPGGHLLHNESIVHSAIREVKEETGLDIKDLKLVGVTGTNGKTSSTYMIEKLMGDIPITRIGTIEYKIGDEVFEAVNTTPESLDLIKIFDKTLKKK